MKRQMLQLFLALLILFSVGGAVGIVGATSANKLAPVTYCSYATQGTTPTKMDLLIAPQGGSPSQSITIHVGDKYILVGKLAAITPQNTLTGIGGATINLQVSGDQQTWKPATSVTTETEGKYLGMYGLEVTTSASYASYIRATYDGDSQYAPTVSEPVLLTVTQ